MFKLSKEPREELLNRGWVEENQLEMDDMEHHFIHTAQPFSPLIIDFVKMFGGSTIKGMSVDPIGVYKSLGKDAPIFYQEYIGRPVAMVGYLSQSVLLITPEGEVYSEFSGYVHHWGETIEKALENIWVRRSYTKIYPTD